MPDIMIRGMEMPTEGGAIGIYKISGNFYAARVGKDELFPLVELPPHGDLIDRDAILNAEKTKPVAKMMMFGGAYVIDLDVVRDAPVVVPAEKGETQ